MGRTCRAEVTGKYILTKYTDLGSSVSSTEKDIDTRLTKAWTNFDPVVICLQVKFLKENSLNSKNYQQYFACHSNLSMAVFLFSSIEATLIDEQQ